ncbi:unnamed protein product, partial [Timema podura]|nr:unnamed protein product [Timema podura]
MIACSPQAIICPGLLLKPQINQSEYSQLELNPAPLSDKVGNVNAVDEVPHVAGQLNNDLYAVPVKRRSQPPVVVADLTAQSPDTDTESGLPSGWEKHEDNDGPYYWHIKSGTIQREPPAMPAPGKTESRRLLVKEAESVSTLVSGLFAALVVVGTSLGKHRSTMVYFNIPDDGFR